MSEQLNKGKNKFDISVLKGPCLAKELARKIKSSTIIANNNIVVKKRLENWRLAQSRSIKKNPKQKDERN